MKNTIVYVDNTKVNDHQLGVGSISWGNIGKRIKSRVEEVVNLVYCSGNNCVSVTESVEMDVHKVIS